MHACNCQPSHSSIVSSSSVTRVERHVVDRSPSWFKYSCLESPVPDSPNICGSSSDEYERSGCHLLPLGHDFHFEFDLPSALCSSRAFNHQRVVIAHACLFLPYLLYLFEHERSACHLLQRQLHSHKLNWHHVLTRSAPSFPHLIKGHFMNRLYLMFEDVLLWCHFVCGSSLIISRGADPYCA